MLNVVLFYAIYLSGFAAAVLRNPVYAFVTYEAVYFFNPQRRWWGDMVPDLSYSYFAVVLMAFVLLTHWQEARKNRLLSPPQFRWMYLLLTLYALAYFQAVLPAEHEQATIYFLKLVIIVSIAYKLCDTARKLDLALFGYILGAWYIGFVAYQVGRNAGGRVEGIGMVDSPDANGTAAAIAPAVVLCLYYFWTSKSLLVKGLITVAAAFIVNGLILINSRGAFLATAASMAYFMLYMYFSSFQRKHQKAVATFVILAGLGGFLYLADDTFFERMKTISGTQIEQAEEKETGATRLYFWQSAIRLSTDYPLGVGFRGFNFYAPQYLPEYLDTGGHRNRSVHSSWFEALTEAGYPALLAVVLMVVSAFRACNETKKALKEEGRVDDYFKVIAIQAALIAFVVAMTFLNRLRAEILYWCILYTACAYNIYVLRPRKEASVSRADPNGDSRLTNPRPKNQSTAP
ncbi:MAG TPA: O-antigen ligase domain-containing protein [Gammaproteobacteria bacterium]|nr:O-antigen ligase domain-containing protein [Gammaproteobacteria bacterium]